MLLVVATWHRATDVALGDFSSSRHIKVHPCTPFFADEFPSNKLHASKCATWFVAYCPLCAGLVLQVSQRASWQCQSWPVMGRQWNGSSRALETYKTIKPLTLKTALKPHYPEVTSPDPWVTWPRWEMSRGESPRAIFSHIWCHALRGKHNTTQWCFMNQLDNWLMCIWQQCGVVSRC